MSRLSLVVIPLRVSRSTIFLRHVSLVFRSVSNPSLLACNHTHLKFPRANDSRYNSPRKLGGMSTIIFTSMCQNLTHTWIISILTSRTEPGKVNRVEHRLSRQVVGDKLARQIGTVAYSVHYSCKTVFIHRLQRQITKPRRING